MGQSKGRIQRVAVIVFLLSTYAFSAQEVEAWFSRSGESGPYAALKPQLMALAASERDAILTDRPLALRLVEGAGKGVNPSKLVEILTEETSQLVASAAILRERGLLPTEKDAANKLFPQLDIALRAGFDVADFSAALDGAISKNGRKPAAATRAIAVLSAMAGLQIDKRDRVDLISAMASGPLPDARLPSIRSSYANLIMKGVSSGDTVKNLRESLGPARPPLGEGPPPQQPNKQNLGRTGPAPGGGMEGPMPGPGMRPGIEPGAAGPKPGRR